ncbi:MAG TPA: TonB-dependent receptor [Terracidiphilus sp.]|nr:TonB-dependent receptor [Terracidiphilus sp.]
MPSRLLNLRATLCVVLFSLSALCMSRAQDQASITGVVTDPSGAVVPGVNVVLTNDLTNVTYKGVTNSVGSYKISDVAPGPGYKIEFSAPGFEASIITGLYLNVNSTRTQDAVLTVGQSTQTVQVSASGQEVTLNTTDATIGNNFQVAYLNQLPIQNRDNPAALFYQQPGVTLGGSVTGSRTDQTNVTVDGNLANDPATGQFGAIVGLAPVDSVQEFSGLVADPTAESGQGGGGQFQLVTKSGTNQFHGDINEYHRDTDLEANDWFNNNSHVPRPPLVRNQFGGSVGGPIKRNKAFFFFDYDGRRDARSALEDRTVPIGTNTTGYRGGQIAYCNNTSPANGCVQSTLTGSQMAALDPQGIGWDPSLLQLFQQRFPMANDTSGAVGDLVNTAGFRFNAPDPYVENVYIQRVDYTINDKMKIYGKGGVAQRSSLENEPEFPGDPEYTYPFYDRSYDYVVGHTWQIGNNKVNQLQYGETYENYNFSVTYNPQGANQFGYSGVSGPYGGGNNSQARTYPMPLLRDDFSWQKGRHELTFGGLFSWQTPNEFAAENYNFVSIGVTGNTNFTSLNTSPGQPSLRPSDISNAWTTPWDSLFSTALGASPEVSSNFNYNNKGAVQTQGSGLSLNYRNYETELYFTDSWRLTPDLTVTYGVRYQNYSVPYETHGDQASAQLLNGSTAAQFNFDTYWRDRTEQSAQGISSNTAIPFIQYVYGGKVNHAPGYMGSQNHNFAPRIAFAWNPSFDKKTVISGAANLVYDYTIINALQFQQLQASYLFEANNTNLQGISGDPYDSLATSDPNSGGLPRFAGISSPPPIPSAPNIATPYVPYVYFPPMGGTPEPYGLPQGQFNILINPQLKTPYNITFGLGVQHEFPQGYILKIDYAGRLGRRLLATADASQLIDFPDNTGGSTQTMTQAESGMVTQLRQYSNLSAYGASSQLSPQPWFEDEFAGLANFLNNYYGGNYFANNTQAASFEGSPYSERGDYADFIYLMSAIGVLPPNVGMASQFSSNSIWTNKGFSNYHGLLATLHKNAGYGLTFDLNYTWQHSIDNVSAIANFIAGGEGFGYICEIQNPRACRGNSDFNVTNEISGTFVYDLPFGKGQMFGAGAPYWLNEAIGGWSLSGLPTWHTGNSYTVYSNAYVAGFANNAPATLIGSNGFLKAKVQHQGHGMPVFEYLDHNAALAQFTGPTGFNIGHRNDQFGPGFFNLDLGLAKAFPIYEDKVNLTFRTDAFNATNHPNFGLPNTDITQSSGTPFGTVGGLVGSPGSDLAVRVLQLSLRLEF